MSTNCSFNLNNSRSYTIISPKTILVMFCMVDYQLPAKLEFFWKRPQDQRVVVKRIPVEESQRTVARLAGTL